ncbi:MAG TPA: ATPase [Mycobacterium sp.]|nr:ATPase [Mycobacterium sp.]
MTIVPSRNESSSGRFRPQTPTARPLPPGQTGPTQRLTNLGQAPAQRTPDRRTRRTVDLSLATHRALDLWQQRAADQLGVARVTGQEVFTALIEQLLADPKLSAQITRAIHNRR